MSYSRREFIQACSRLAIVPPLLSLGIAPRVWALTAQQSSKRQKLEDFVQDAARVAALKRGVATMKARKASDPTSWFYQSAVHAVTPEAVQAALQVDPAIANVDQARYWNQCPHTDNQNSADFLIWHRAYIYYFERILREASGDPTLSLPYWNYTDATQRGFPKLFADADPDPITQQTRNPLFDHRREQAFMFGLYELSEGTAGTAAIFRETEFFGATEDTGLAGGVADHNARTRGRLESQPHDLIHFAIGGAVGTGEIDQGEATAGLMASVATAAFDPVFWVHHTNIDRLWTIWDCLNSPPRSWGAVPPKEWLESAPWFFNDVSRKIENHSRLYYLDRRNLQVLYDTDTPACKPLTSTDPLTTGTKVSSGELAPFAIGSEIKSFVQKAEAGVRQGKARVSPDQPYSVDVPLKSLPGSLGGGTKNALMNATKSVPRRIVLDIEDLNVEGVTSVGFDVYVDLPEGSAPSRDSLNYVGTLSVFGTHHSNDNGRHGATPSVQRFDISRVVTLREGLNNSILRTI